MHGTKRLLNVDFKKRSVDMTLKGDFPRMLIFSAIWAKIDDLKKRYFPRILNIYAGLYFNIRLSLVFYLFQLFNLHWRCKALSTNADNFMKLHLELVYWFKYKISLKSDVFVSKTYVGGTRPFWPTRKKIICVFKYTPDGSILRNVLIKNIHKTTLTLTFLC